MATKALAEILNIEMHYGAGATVASVICHGNKTLPQLGKIIMNLTL